MPDGTQQGPGSPPKWTLNTNGLNLNPPHRFMEVRNQSLKGQNLNGEGVWRSKSVSIPNGDTVTARVVVSSSGALDANDSLTFGYSLNGNGNSVAQQLVGDFGTDTITVAGLTGSSIELFVRMENDGNGTNVNFEDHGLKDAVIIAAPDPDDAICVGTPHNSTNCCNQGASNPPLPCPTFENGQSPFKTICVGEQVQVGHQTTDAGPPFDAILPSHVWITDNADNNVTASVLSGSPTCNVSGFGDVVCDPNGGQTNITFNSSAATGLYEIHASNHGGGCNSGGPCSDAGLGNVEVLVKVTEPPQGQVQLTDNPICEGESTSITYNGPGTASLNIVGGLGGACSVSGTGTSTLDLTGCQPGTYSIEVKFGNKCGKSTQFLNLTVYERPTADAGPDIEVCEDDLPVQLGGSPSASGGTPPYTYNWTGDTGPLNNTGVPNPTFDNASPGTYDLTLNVGDANGCINRDNVTVTVKEQPELNLYGPSNPTICEEQDPQQAQYFTVIDKKQDLSVSGPNSVVNCITFGNIKLCSIILSPTTTTTYTVTLTNPNGCTDTRDITVNVADCECDDHNVAQTPGNPAYVGSNVAPVQGYASNVGPFPPGVEDITIDGNFVIDVPTYSISGKDVRMIGHDNTSGPDDTKIIIPDGNTLIIEAGNNNNAHLFACEEMWQGIEVKGGGELIVKENSEIEDGVEAIKLRNGPTGGNASLLELHNSRLNKNLDHVVSEPYDVPTGGSHPAEIYGTSFTCDGSLLANAAGASYTDRGVLIQNVLSSGGLSDGFVIGDPNQDPNIFDRMKIGVYAAESSFKVQNSEFSDLDRPSGQYACPNPPCTGTAIFGVGGPNTRAWVGGPNDGEPNILKDVYRGVDLQNYTEIRVIENSFDNQYQNNPNLTGTQCIEVEEQNVSQWDIEINGNSIEDWDRGIRVVNLLKGEGLTQLDINNNRIFNPTANFNNFGISVENATGFTGSDPWNILNNDISETQGGIYVVNSRQGSFTIGSNDIEMEPNLIGAAFGIKLEDCDFLKLTSNDIQGVNGNYDNPNNMVFGIHTIVGGTGLEFCQNRIENVRNGIRREGNVPFLFNGSIVKNRFEDFHRGIALFNGARISNQGSPSRPSGNEMVTTGDWDVFADGTSNNNDATFHVYNGNVNRITNGETFGVSSSFPVLVTSQPIPAGCSSYFLKENDNGPASPYQTSARSSGNTVLQAERIAGDSMSYSYAPQASEWWAKNKVYKGLKRDSSLGSSSPMLQAFKDSLDQSAMGRIWRIDSAVKAGDIAYAQGQNNSMSCTCPIESRYKEFFQVYLNSVAIDSACSSSQISTLWDIAEECPLQEGEAVYRARVVLRSELDSNIRFDADCSPDSVQAMPEQGGDGQESGTVADLEEEKKGVEKPSFQWRPNPTEGPSELFYDLGGRERARIRISDLQGRVLEKDELRNEQGNYELDLSEYEAGIYLYRIRSRGEELKTGRLMLTR